MLNVAELRLSCCVSHFFSFIHSPTRQIYNILFFTGFFYKSVVLTKKLLLLNGGSSKTFKNTGPARTGNWWHMAVESSIGLGFFNPMLRPFPSVSLLHTALTSRPSYLAGKGEERRIEKTQTYTS